MQTDEDFKKLYILIDKIVLDANIEGTIQHVNALDSMDFMRKEANRSLFRKGELMQALGRHSYSGSYDPSGPQKFITETFSVGVFQWMPTKDGERRKKGKVKVRVIGSCLHPNHVYEKANEVIEELNEGTYKGPKNVKV